MVFRVFLLFGSLKHVYMSLWSPVPLKKVSFYLENWSPKGDFSQSPRSLAMLHLVICLMYEVIPGILEMWSLKHQLQSYLVKTFGVQVSNVCLLQVFLIQQPSLIYFNYIFQYWRIKHRYINFTFIDAGGDVRKLVHMAKFGQKTGIFTYFQCNLTYFK